MHTHTINMDYQGHMPKTKTSIESSCEKCDQFLKSENISLILYDVYKHRTNRNDFDSGIEKYEISLENDIGNNILLYDFNEKLEESYKLININQQLKINNELKEINATYSLFIYNNNEIILKIDKCINVHNPIEELISDKKHLDLFNLFFINDFLGIYRTMAIIKKETKFKASNCIYIDNSFNLQSIYNFIQTKNFIINEIRTANSYKRYEIVPDDINIFDKKIYSNFKLANIAKCISNDYSIVTNYINQTNNNSLNHMTYNIHLYMVMCNINHMSLEEIKRTLKIFGIKSDKDINCDINESLRLKIKEYENINEMNNLNNVKNIE